MNAPWWFCNGWWSPWCVIDTIAHKLGLPLAELSDDAPEHPYYWICRKHDAAVERRLSQTNGRQQ